MRKEEIRAVSAHGTIEFISESIYFLDDEIYDICKEWNGYDVIEHEDSHGQVRIFKNMSDPLHDKNNYREVQ